MMHNSNILIIGGGGFIGSKLAEKLCEENHITVLDVCEKDKCSLSARGLLGHRNIYFIQGDAAKKSDIRDLGTDYDFIIHASAILGIHTVTELSIKTIDTNVISCKNVLELAARQKHLSKFLTFSTSEVYGTEAMEVDETMEAKVGPATESRWCYAASKLLSEHITSAYSRERGIRSVIIRPFNVFGPFRYGSNAVSKITANALCGEEIEISGNGKQLRAWCYIDDFVEGLISALTLDSEFNIFNLGNPVNNVSILELAQKITKIAGSDSEIVISGSDEPDVLSRLPNIDKAREELSYNPVWSLDDALKETINWMKSMEPFDRSLFV